MAKQATRATILNDYKYMGKEPEFGSAQVLTETQLARAYSWYSHFNDTETAKGYLRDYAAANKIKINLRGHTHNTFGWIARMKMRGAPLPPHVELKFKTYIMKLNKIKEEVEDEVIMPVSNTPELVKLSANDRPYLEDFEEAIDNYPHPFSAYNYLTTKNLPQIHTKAIIEFYAPKVVELIDAYDKKSPDLVEAYRHLKRTEMKVLIKLYSDILSDCERFLGNVKKQRTPRKTKPKSADTLLKNFRYQKEDAKLKLMSEDPSKIIGAQALYVLNTKSNVFTVFVAKDDKGFSINRTAITNFDEKKSISKKVGRKLEEVVKLVNEGTKRSRLNIMDKVKTGECKFTDRLNETTIILKVDK